MPDHHFDRRGRYVGSTMSDREVGEAAKFAGKGCYGCFMMIGIPAFIIACVGGLLAGGYLLFEGVRSGINNTADNWTSPRARTFHTATLLGSGKVLVVGGYGNTTTLASAELYDPASKTWSSANSMSTARQRHTATLLPSGKVLVVGGNGTPSADWHDGITSVELYDPTSNTWLSAASMNSARSGHTATLLPSGKVLVVGGNGTTSAELYDPTSNTWMPAASTLVARNDYHTTTLLSSGKVLVVGGSGKEPEEWGDGLASVELYDPASDTWSSAARTLPRNGHTATLLPSGKVLVAGKILGAHDRADLPRVAMLYDPLSNLWEAAPQMNFGRGGHTATLLPSGKVLVVGGRVFGGTGPTSVELYDPDYNTWVPVASMSSEHPEHTATLLGSGKVLVVGYHVDTKARAELYDPESNTWSSADK